MVKTYSLATAQLYVELVTKGNVTAHIPLKVEVVPLVIKFDASFLNWKPSFDVDPKDQTFIVDLETEDQFRIFTLPLSTVNDDS